VTPGRVEATSVPVAHLEGLREFAGWMGQSQLAEALLHMADQLGLGYNVIVLRDIDISEP